MCAIQCEPPIDQPSGERCRRDPDNNNDSSRHAASYDALSLQVETRLKLKDHLTDFEVDALADVMTFEEKRGSIRGRTVAWSGDANNVLASWMHAAERFEFQLRVATPAELKPKKWLVDWIKSSGAAIEIGEDPEAAVKNADCVVTDTWVSMGDKDGKLRHNLLKRYQVNAALMARAKPDAVFMHCLPAHRGDEVTDEVIDGPQSVVFDEAENRLHAQKGILAWCFDAVA